MLDLQSLREHPDEVVERLTRRGGAFESRIRVILDHDRERRDALTRVNELKAQRNETSRRIGELKRAGEEASAMIVEMREVGEAIAELDERVREAEAVIAEELAGLPNLPAEVVPVGGEEANRVVDHSGEPAAFDFAPRPHWEIAEALGILDLPRGAKISGSGFPVLVGRGARLQRGLIDFFLNRHTRHSGYVELRVPYFVTREAMTGTGQLPKFAEESYHAERDDLWAIPTAEVPVTNMHRDEILEIEDLPVRYTASTPCFRREAGAAGRDTRGLLRVHQFDKVELVRYETPERSAEALEEMVHEAGWLLDALELHWRRVELATADLGFSASRTFDLEVWAPGVEQWLEVSSVSDFGDFQARRAGLRYRPSAGAKPRFLHTLNGSALALPRVMAALLETGQQRDGSVVLPAVLAEVLDFDRLEPSGD
ncbi:MAG: serine--tRNA ligase [Longimicrobiales bacterium]|nr:serine--tRNA ligase [Longimicrobiales bacterium]